MKKKTENQDSVFQRRLDRHHDELRWLYMELYDNSSMFAELCDNLYSFYKERNKALKDRDIRREDHPDWYKQNDMLGMMFYIDNFAGNMSGVEKKLDYLEKSNVNYIHLMPFLDTPEGRSDGGYAVSDFRKVQERLGTMEELEHLTAACHKKNMNVCMDFVMNHTSEEHEWAKKARQGDGEYMSRYFFYDDHTVPEMYEKTVPQVFPTTAPGNFTWLPDAGHYVMTSFYPYQWDLNYRNPRVFNEMMYNFLFLVNHGIDIIRIDAVPYIWKELNTQCRNLKQVHTIVRMMRIISEIVCPGVLLLGEVVMEPEKVVPYFGTVEKPECHMLYNVTTMATTWHTVATRDAQLLRKQLDIVNALPKDYVFLNYLRCHDDIGWGLDYDTLLREGMGERSHKQYLNDYFQGLDGNSNSRGELYNADPVTGDARFCGTTASMCGIEKAEAEKDAEALKRAVRMDVMLHAYMFMQSGIPVLYSGDEIGQINDYTYKDDPGKADDSRYVHRGAFNWKRAEQIEDKDSVAGQIFDQLGQLEKIRKSEPVFVCQADTWTIDTHDSSVLCIGRYYDGEKILGIFNFSEYDKTAWINEADGIYTDMISGEKMKAGGVNIPAYGFYYLKRDREDFHSLFKNPTAQYRGIPFWSWNCRVTRELIDWQLDCFAKMGFGGVDIHPRTGLDTEYLGEEYMQLVEYTVERCREKGLLCWLYDEDRFPSGVAGGMVTKDFRFRGRFLLLTQKHCDGGILPGYCEDKGSFDMAVEEGKKPLGYYAAAYGITFQNGYMKEYRRLYTSEEISQAREKGEKVRFAYVKIMEEDPWLEDQAYVDTMNPEAIAQFIRLTHDAYDRAVGQEFGKTVPAIFTDEPRLGNHAQIHKALSEEDVTMPYTDYLAEQMRLKYGIEPLDIAPEYIWELADGKYSENRYRYKEMTMECFAGAFMDQICDWCEAHGIAMTGHVLGEETLGSQSVTVGDCMRCYRKMDIPGIDILVDAHEFTTAKQAASVARQNGRKGVVSELYGVTHWDCDFATYKLQGDWQAALGVTVRVPHLSYMSMKGEAKRDWPASIFYQSPWYEEFPYVEDHFARLNTVLTRGRAMVNIAVVHPVESLWICSGPDDQTAGVRREMNRDFQNLTGWLLYGTMDFDFLSEALLPEQCGECGQKSKTLRVGCMEYKTVVVPGLKTIRSTTLDILEAFCDRGGKLIFMGRIPGLVDGRESDRARKLAEKCISIHKDENELLSALREERILEIRKENGLLSDNLFYQMREDGDSKWLYVCHVNRKNNHISSGEKYEFRIKGIYTVTLYDTMTGNTREIPVEWDNGDTILKRSMYGEDSILLRLKACAGAGNLNTTKDGNGASCEEAPCKGASCEEAPCEGASREGVSCEEASYEGAYFEKKNGRVVMKLASPDSFSRTEPNVLLLDYARYQVDDGPVQPREEILRADNRIRSQLGFVLRGERMNQPWFMQEKETHKVTLYYEVLSEIETEVSLAMEDVEHSKVTLNGESVTMSPTGYYVDPDIQTIALPKLQKGKNDLKLEIDYNQKSGLENIFLLGDFDVELSGSRTVIREERKKIEIGDITRQGMPFYTGNLEYTFRFVVEEKDTFCVLHVPGFKSPVLAVFLDGKKMGLIAYAPHQLCLGQIAPGEHELTILLYGNRFNGFGTLHNANDDYVWYGPDSYRTTGDDWTDCYQLRPVGIMAAMECSCFSGVI